ncbi:hypothetical protein ABH942_000217 [Flavobacterium sp. 28YEA47A]|uniref:CCC motif membrane protein n=1 Tax=Flavobacterium sp. 28YEA47A TaxID=3156276 RepID=UPI0035112D91
MEKQKLPNALAVLILGILSILTCCCYGVIGLILAIVALVLAAKDKKLYLESPELYSNYSNLNTGKILAIIGIVLNMLVILFYIWLISRLGLEGMQDPQQVEAFIKDTFGA